LLADPNPASSVAHLLQFLPEAVKTVLA